MSDKTEQAAQRLADETTKLAQEHGFHGNLANQVTRGFVEDTTRGKFNDVPDFETVRDIVSRAVEILRGRR